MTVRRALWLAVLAASVISSAGLVGCARTAAPASGDTPAAPAAASATPDVYATSVQRTLAAMAAEATLTREALTEVATTDATPSATASRTPSPQAGDTETPTPTPSATLTATATETLTPMPSPVLPGEDGVLATTEPLGLIRSFDAIPAAITPGDSVTLTWSASGDWATLYTLDPRGTFSQFWEVPLTGTRTLPTSDNVRDAVRYILFVGRGELSESRMASVNVLCPDRWFFAGPPDSCPQAPATRGGGAAQAFERGRMVWVGSQGLIYVLYGDGGSPAYNVFPDEWQPGMAESDPSLSPPPGLIQPVRGFGRLWRGEGAAGPSVRERLGWALSPEVGYEAVIQCDSAPKYNTCYLAVPGGEIIVLEPEQSGWRVWGDGG